MPASGDPSDGAPARRLAFGRFVADLRRGEQTRDGELAAPRRMACELQATLAPKLLTAS